MNIWIIEDEVDAARRAFDLVMNLELGEAVKVFRDKTILWGADLEKMPPKQGDFPVCKFDHMPDIVVLDLLDKDGQFRAGEFYNRLRSEEVGHPPAAFIIVWSMKTGLPSVNEFLTRKPLVDRRLTFTNSKTDAALKAALHRAINSWREAKYL